MPSVSQLADDLLYARCRLSEGRMKLVSIMPSVRQLADDLLSAKLNNARPSGRTLLSQFLTLINCHRHLENQPAAVDVLWMIKHRTVRRTEYQFYAVCLYAVQYTNCRADFQANDESFWQERVSIVYLDALLSATAIVYVGRADNEILTVAAHLYHICTLVGRQLNTTKRKL